MDITIILISAILPLLSFLLLSFKKKKEKADLIGITLQGIAAVLSLELLLSNLLQDKTPLHVGVDWLKTIGFSVELGLMYDSISAVMFAMVSFISLLVHIFSSSYMHGDKDFKRYFALLGLFTFSMYGVILTDNVLLIYIFWELVGFCSYMLIGFWRQKKSAIKASKKAFVLNRIGDAGFLVGLLSLFALFGTAQITEVYTVFQSGDVINAENVFWLKVAGFGFFMGAVAKSAQVPLAIWLPDAMEGPTPVSALIHAATMVAAGVYLLVRLSFLLTPEVQLLIATVGAVTAFMAGFAALSQYDIKKILAFSTISQLGYMMVGIGVGTVDGAFFHLVAHAFFKAGLFLGAGSVIHGMHYVSCNTCQDFDPQDIRFMGGLKKFMPKTFLAFALCGGALAGLPLFSGFLSKDIILAGALTFAQQQGGLAYIIPLLGFATALLTALYVGRLIFRVFFGEMGISYTCPNCFTEPHEVGKRMTIPVSLLAVLSFWFVFSINPLSGTNGWFLQSVNLPSVSIADNMLLTEILSVGVVGVGLGLAYMVYVNTQLAGLKDSLFPSHSILRKLSFNFFYLDYLYTAGVNIILKFVSSLNKAPSPDNIFVQSFIWCSVFIRNFDNAIVDAFVRFLGVASVLIAHVSAFFDRVFVDGFVNSIVYLTGRAGIMTKSVQGGKVQAYLTWAILLLVILIWILVG